MPKDTPLKTALMTLAPNRFFGTWLMCITTGVVEDGVTEATEGSVSRTHRHIHRTPVSLYS